MELFFQIPGHNQTDVLKKMEYRDFVRFMKCSRKTVELGRNFNHRVSMDVDSIMFSKHQISLKTSRKSEFFDLKSVQNEQVRFVANIICIEHDYWNRTECLNLCKNMKAKRLYVDRMMSTGEQLFDENGGHRFPLKTLIKLLQVKSLEITRSPHIDDLTEFNKLQEIKIVVAKMDASVFLQLKVPKIDIWEANEGNLPLHCLNTFFTEWVAGKRQVEKLVIKPIPSEYSDIFRGLDFVVEDVSWVPEEIRNQYVVEFNIVSLTRKTDAKTLYLLFCRDDSPPWMKNDQMKAGEHYSIFNFINTLFKTNDDRPFNRVFQSFGSLLSNNRP